VLVGPSGCGKSTTLRMIAGLESISHGDLVIGGKTANDMPSRDRGVATVFQTYALYPHLSVRENLVFSLKLAKVAPAGIDQQATPLDALSDATVTPAIIATFVWQTVGLVMVLLLPGLAAIPKDPIEAAHIDGASPWQIFRHITLLLLSPTLVMVTILSGLAGFTVFDLLWVMGASYPGQRSLALAVFPVAVHLDPE